MTAFEGGRSRGVGATLACVITVVVSAAGNFATADQPTDERISECMYAGFRPGSAMFATCVQPAQTSGLGPLNSPQLAPPQSAVTVPIPPVDGVSPYGAPNVLLDSSYQQLLGGSDPVWDTRR